MGATALARTTTAGFPILDPLTQEDSSEEPRQRLYYRGSGAETTGEYTEDGLVVFEGSTARLDTASSAGESIARRRQNLREDGVLAVKDDALVFQQDHAFNSPSGAAGVVLGRSSNVARNGPWMNWSGSNRLIRRGFGDEAMKAPLVHAHH
jgi:hypothetical protein